MKVKINVLNHNLERFGVVDEYKSFTFIRHFNDVGEFTIVINSASKQANLLKKDAFIIVENDTKKFGRIGHRTIKQEKDGTSTFTIKGTTLGIILDRREIVMHQNEVHDKVDGNIETVLHHYVQNHCINPSDSNRRFPLLHATQDKKRGQYVRWSSSKGRVLDTIKTISNLYDVGWRIDADMDNQRWLFDVYEGRNLSINQDVHSPVIFSERYENITEMEYVEDDADERNFAYVESDGEGTNRKLYETERISGYERREITFEISGRDDEDKYVDVPDLANKQLGEYFTIKKLDARIRDCKMFKYEHDYDLGDIVTIQNDEWKVSEDLRIVSIEETYSDNGLDLFATFGKRIPSLIDKIKRERKVEEIDR